VKREEAGVNKAVKLFLLIVIAAILLLALCGIYIVTRDYGDYFIETKGTLAESKTTPFAVDTLFSRGWLSIRSDAGLNVECGLLVPANERLYQRYPAVILLGGKATGKHAVDYALGIRNVIIVAPDYPYTPRESYTFTQFLSDLPEMRKAALDLVPSVMLLTDYLSRRPDVDTTKIILLGYSFGAPFIPCIAAHDKRAAVAVIVFGGGDIRGMIRHNVRRYEGPFVSELVSILGELLLRPLEPLRYADAISPMPLLMINGSEDEQIPAKYTEDLYARAKEPKRLVWLEARHVNPRNVDLTRLIVATLKHELVQMNVLTGEN
jgi:dienelactone hydrolase